MLSNLVFVVNCNLQRLDGPVHGNGKIIQVLETIFRGAGWNVIKVIWGDRWDPLLEADEDGLLVRRMEEAVDGEYQTYKARSGAFVREKFFGKYPELAERVKDMSDEEIWALNRGGHDARKVYAAYAAAQGATGRPTVVLAKTIKGYGMGEAGEGQNITHQQKKMNEEALRAFRDRFDSTSPTRRSARSRSTSHQTTHPRSGTSRSAGRRWAAICPSVVAASRCRSTCRRSTPSSPSSTGRASARFRRPWRSFASWQRSCATRRSARIVLIVADESRTFGMEGMFRQLGIYSHVGQLYEPEDAGS